PSGTGSEHAPHSNELGFCAIEDPLSRPSLASPTRNDPLTADSLARTIYGSPAPVDPTLVKCQAGLSKAIATYVKTRIKALQRCNESVAAGAIPGPRPDDATINLLNDARAKLDGSIRGKCTEAQLAASSPPDLTFGKPCEAYKLVVFRRDDSTNNNSIPMTDRLISCLADAAAGVVDREI